MSRKRREWSFDNAIKEAAVALRENRTMAGELESVRRRITGPMATPQVQAGCLDDTIGVVRRCEALVLARRQPDQVWPRLHLIWRYEAFRWRLYLDRATQLAAEFPEKAKKGKLGIGIIDAQYFNAVLMTMAFSATLGETAAARWFGDRCLRIVTENELIAQPGAWNTGSVEQYLLRLYCIWRGVEFDFAGSRICSFGPYKQVFDHWNNLAELEQDTLKLCKLHAGKVVNFDLADEDFIFGLQHGVYCEFPVEILFLQRVRKDLGLSVPNPEHPLLRSPFVQVPFPCPRSGYDESIAEIYANCKKVMPDLNIPWEEEIQAAGPNDPRRVPVLDAIPSD